MPGLQCPHLAGDAEEIAEKIFDMRREIDEQVAFGLAVERLGVGAPRHQPVVQTDIGRREMRDEGAIEPDQPVALVKVGKSEPVFQGEIGHAVLIRRSNRGKPSANRRDSTARTARRSPPFPCFLRFRYAHSCKLLKSREFYLKTVGK